MPKLEFKGGRVPWYPNEPKPLSEIEETRELYIFLLDLAAKKGNRDKIIEYLDLFNRKLEEARLHEELAEELEVKQYKSKLILLWKGLIEEAKRRLR